MMNYAATAAVAASKDDKKVPKALRSIDNHGHDFIWASCELNYAATRGHHACITSAQQAQLAPATVAAYEAAVARCSPTQLLHSFSRLAAESHSRQHVALLDFADAYRNLLSRLVAAVCPTENYVTASYNASEYLHHALEYHSNSQASHSNSQLRQAWSSGDGVVPADPTPLLLNITKAFIGIQVLGSADDEYRDYLINRFRFVDSSSLPSAVYNRTCTLVRSHGHRTSVAAHDSEVKLMFKRWVSHYAQRDDTLAKLLRPLMDLFVDVNFIYMSLTDLETQINLHETPNGRLAPLVAALNASSAGTSHRQRAARVNGLASDVPSGPWNPSVAAYWGVPPQQQTLQLAPAQPVVQMVQPAQLTQPTQTPVQMVQPAASAQLTQPTQPVVQMVQQPALLPVSSGLHHSMASNFVAAVSLPSFLPDRDVAFGIPSGKMDAEWVGKYGCQDLGCLPNAKTADRFWLRVVPICETLGIPLPDTFVDETHVGGASCPFCAFVSQNQGFTFVWHEHADGQMKPIGRQHKYKHQVFRCSFGHALIHRAVRLDRDAGREPRVTLFVERERDQRG